MDTTSHTSHTPYITTIALIGALHDNEGNMSGDDIQLLDNTVTYLEKSGISVSPGARILPMTLGQDEDIMKVRPQVDLAILCYIYDDHIDQYSDKPNDSFWAQSDAIKGKTGSERYSAWQEALEKTGAKIILSLGHPEEISVKKAAPENYTIIMDPEIGTDEIPPMKTKQPRKQKSYGIAINNSCIVELAALTNNSTELGRTISRETRQEDILAL